MTDADLIALSDRYGTPLYVFDERVLLERIASLEAALPGSCEVCYAIKTNPFVVGAVAEHVSRIEACSPGEVSICRSAGVGIGQLVVSGVHKSPELIEELVSGPVRPKRFTVESLAQLELLDRTARAHNTRVPVLVRLSSGNQFGVDEAALRGIIARRDELFGLDIVGLQYFTGTQKSRPRRLQREVARLDAILGELFRDYGWEARELEYGPGLAVAYFRGDDFDEAGLLSALSEALEGMAYSGPIVIELGRSIAASCGTYLTRVVDAKENAGSRYAILDGGIHHLVYFGQSMAMHQPPCRLLAPGGGRPVTGPGRGVEDAEVLWNLCGSLCSVNDILAKQMSLPGLGTGSLLAFDLAGAYCMTEGMGLFLSRDLPAVVLVDACGSARVVRAALPTHPLNTPAPV